MRLIDADPLYMGIALYLAENAYLNDTALDALKKAAEWVKESPAIDAVPVVRCPACSWRTNSSFCRRHGHYVRDDFFCAYGTTGDVRGCRPAKKIEKKAEERCLATGGPCSRCTPGPCDHRKTVIADDRGQ